MTQRRPTRHLRQPSGRSRLGDGEVVIHGVSQVVVKCPCPPRPPPAREANQAGWVRVRPDVSDETKPERGGPQSPGSGWDSSDQLTRSQSAAHTPHDRPLNDQMDDVARDDSRKTRHRNGNGWRLPKLPAEQHNQGRRDERMK